MTKNRRKIQTKLIQSESLKLSYLLRDSVKSITYLLGRFPCVVVLGARQVGKSTLLGQVLPESKVFDLERPSVFQRVHNDPELFIQETPRPLLIDEAQLSTELFKALRVEIDKNRRVMGQFLLTGSSSPQLLQNISESLAGRVAIFELDPLTWHEAVNPLVENKLLQEDFTNPEQLKQRQPAVSKAELLQLCLHGAYPEPYLGRSDHQYWSLWMENYIKTYVERDVRALFPQLNLQSFRRFVQMMAYASGNLINYSDFARSLDISQPTIKHYFEIAEGTFLWRRITSYATNTKKRMVKMPKGHLRDTGLINYFLRINDVDDLKSHPQFGRIWETFIIEQLIRSFNNRLEKVDYCYYRTQNQAEIDLVLQGKFGVIPIEIKSGSYTEKKQLKTLTKFIEENNCPFGLVINNGDEIFKMTDKIYQLPAIYL